MTTLWSTLEELRFAERTDQGHCDEAWAKALAAAIQIACRSPQAASR